MEDHMIKLTVSDMMRMIEMMAWDLDQFLRMLEPPITICDASFLYVWNKRIQQEHHKRQDEMRALLQVVSHFSIQTILENAFADDQFVRKAFTSILDAACKHHEIAKVVLHSEYFWNQASKPLTFNEDMHHEIMIYDIIGEITHACKGSEIQSIIIRRKCLERLVARDKALGPRLEIKNAIIHIAVGIMLNSPKSIEIVFKYVEKYAAWTLPYVHKQVGNIPRKSKKHFSIPEICGACGKTSARRACGRCRSICYCDEQCQAKHWKEHRKCCKKVQLI